MAWEIPGNPKLTLVAHSDLSSSQYRFVKVVAGGDGDHCDVCNSAADIPIGILQNNPLAGKEAEIMVIGLSKVKASSALTLGWLIGTSNDGRADRKIPGTDTTEYVVGTVVEPVAAANSIGTISLNCFNPHRAA